ncbi:MAG: hypothetical protein ACM3QX_04510 [Syntrophomonadaceae bacterium]
MENDNNYVNDHGDLDQGGRRPGTRPEEFEGENETTGYGHKRKVKDEKKSGSGLEEYKDKQQEKKDSDPNPLDGQENIQNE